MNDELRKKKALTLISKTGFGLEIGPSYNPLAPRSSGWNVDVVDHANAESLKVKYAAWGVDVSAIEKVQYVIEEDSDLFNTIGQQEKYDFIIASHVIEHVPDPLTFLQNCQLLLKDGGILSLIVPDKRYCFDIFRPVSTVGQLLDAFSEKRKRHSPGTIFDAHAYHARRGDQIAFPNIGHVNDLNFAHTAAYAKSVMDDFLHSQKYLDVHAWVYTPSSFQLILSELLSLSLLDFKLEFFDMSYPYEFYLSLRKTAFQNTNNDAVRLALSAQIFQEEVQAKFGK